MTQSEDRAVSQAKELIQKFPKLAYIYKVTESDLQKMIHKVGFELPKFIKNFLTEYGFVDYIDYSKTVEPNSDLHTFYFYGFNRHGNWFYSLYELMLATVAREVQFDQSFLLEEADYFKYGCYVYAYGALKKDNINHHEYYCLFPDGSTDIVKISASENLNIKNILLPYLNKKNQFNQIILESKQRKINESEKLPNPNYLRSNKSLFEIVKQVKEKRPEVVEIFSVSSSDIIEAEKIIGFAVPDQLRDFWMSIGSFSSWKDQIAIDADGIVSQASVFIPTNVFMNSKTMMAQFFDFFIPDEEMMGELYSSEKEYLNKCFYVYGLTVQIIDDIAYSEVFYCDALGRMNSLRYANVDELNLENEIGKIIQQKNEFKDFLSQIDSSVTKKSAQSTTDTKDGFLQHYGIQIKTYEEVCDLLSLNNIFANHRRDEDHSQEDDDFNSDDESPYHEKNLFSEFLYFDGDLTISGNFKVPETYSHMNCLIVNGNLKVNGRIDCHYYVTGNSEFDLLSINSHQKTCGEEQVNYVTVIYAEDDESLAKTTLRNINSKIFLNWYTDLNCFNIAPETCIIAMCPHDHLDSYQTKNIFLKWHNYAYALRPHLYSALENASYNVSTWSEEAIMHDLKNGKSIFVEGFNYEAFAVYNSGLQLFEQDDFYGAFCKFKESIKLWPTFSLAFGRAGVCLQKVKAYTQAIDYLKKAIELMPTQVKYPSTFINDSGMYCCLAARDFENLNIFMNDAKSRDVNNYFYLRSQAEVCLNNNNLDEAERLLTQSIEGRSIFSNNWLLGLVYYKKSQIDLAKKYFDIAKTNNSSAYYYDQDDSLNSFYGENVYVDWDDLNSSTTVVEKNQDYWNDYFHRRKEGPLDYGRPQALLVIPEEFRTVEMLNYYLDYRDAQGGTYISGDIITLFPSKILTQEHIYKALDRDSQCSLENIPKTLRDEKVYFMAQIHDISEVPKEFLSYNFYCHLVQKSFTNFAWVPESLRDEKMFVSQIVGGILKSHDKHLIPDSFMTQDMIKKAIDLNFKTLKEIPAALFDQNIFDHAQSRYGTHPEWEKLVSEHSRDCYKLHREDTEFYSNVLDDVWACFWSEDYLIKALTQQDENNRSKLYQIPERYITKRIAEKAVEIDSYNFMSVPRQFKTTAMCLSACSRQYGSMIEYVPIDLRSQQVCEASVQRGSENLKFVPQVHRSADLCYQALVHDEKNLLYIPYENYVEVFNRVLKLAKFKSRKDFIYFNRGIGHFFLEEYKLAQKDFQKIVDDKNSDETLLAKSLFLLGWICFKQNDKKEALLYLKKCKELDYDDDGFIVPFEEAELPPVQYSVNDFSFDDFDLWMRKAEAFIKLHDYKQAETCINNVENILKSSQTSEMSYWALLWDFQRFLYFENGDTKKWEKHCFDCYKKLSQVHLWEYLEIHNPIRAAIRSFANAIAFTLLQKANTEEDVLEALKYSKIVFKTISVIEDKNVLNPFYETLADIYRRATDFNSKYQKDLDKIENKIKKITSN